MCGSTECRGIISGKTQRSNGNPVKTASIKSTKGVGRPPKGSKSAARLRKLKERQKDCENQETVPKKRPMSHRERCFAQKQGLFLLRNINKVRYMRNTKVTGRCSGRPSNRTIANVSKTGEKNV